jgi:hypothetical protein
MAAMLVLPLLSLLDLGGWRTFNDLCVPHSHEGCPILAFLQGWAVMLRVLSDFAVDT